MGRGIVATLLGRSDQKQRRDKGGPVNCRGQHESVSPRGAVAGTVSPEFMPLNNGNMLTSTAECMPFNLSTAFTPSADTEDTAFNGGKSCTPQTANSGHQPFSGEKETLFGRTASTSYLSSDSPSSFAQNSFHLLEERIEHEVRERQKLWGWVMDELGASQATVKRLEEKLEDLGRMFQEQKGCSHKPEGTPQESIERFNALESFVERLTEHYGMLQVKFDTLQKSPEAGTSAWQTEKHQNELQTHLSQLALQLQEAQLTNERRNQQLHAAISELQSQVHTSDNCSALEARFKAEIVHRKCSEDSFAEQLADVHARSERRCSSLEARVDGVCLPEFQAQVLVKEACIALEARLKAEIVQCKCSQDSLAEQLAEIHARSDRRCSALETRLGGVCVPELVGSMSERLHARINTLHALMEQRYSFVKPQVCDRLSSGPSCNGGTREPSPLAGSRRSLG